MSVIEDHPDREHIDQALARGESYRIIAKHHGVPLTSLYRYAKDHGEASTGRRPTAADLEATLAALEADTSSLEAQHQSAKDETERARITRNLSTLAAARSTELAAADLLEAHRTATEGARQALEAATAQEARAAQLSCLRAAAETANSAEAEKERLIAEAGKTLRQLGDALRELADTQAHARLTFLAAKPSEALIQELEASGTSCDEVLLWYVGTPLSKHDRTIRSRQHARDPYTAIAAEVLSVALAEQPTKTMQKAAKAEQEQKAEQRHRRERERAEREANAVVYIRVDEDHVTEAKTTVGDRVVQTHEHYNHDVLLGVRNKDRVSVVKDLEGALPQGTFWTPL